MSQIAIPNPDHMSEPGLEKFCDTPLQAAAYMGDTERIRELINARADLNTAKLRYRISLIRNYFVRYLS